MTCLRLVEARMVRLLDAKLPLPPITGRCLGHEDGFVFTPLAEPCCDRMNRSVESRKWIRGLRNHGSMKEGRGKRKEGCLSYPGNHEPNSISWEHAREEKPFLFDG